MALRFDDTAPQQLARQRRRAPWLLVAIVGVAVVVGAVIVAVTDQGPAKSFAKAPYSPQLTRNFESVGNPAGPLSQQAVDEIAKNNSYEFLPKFADHYNIEQHFQDASRIVAAAKSYGHDIKVFDYYNTTYWFTANETGWGKYAEGFQQSWLMRDVHGQPIAFHDHDDNSTGYLLDLSNPDYRAWALATIVAWMKAAPYSGISFDTATPMAGGNASRAIADGNTTYNELLCGDVSAVSTGNCSRVQAWDAGLDELLGQTTKTLNAMGDQVRYNGIASSELRGPSRNVGTLQYTDIASNESFCLDISPNDPSRTSYSSIVEDAQLMRQIAAEHKKVTEVTNVYGSSDKQKFGDYCVAGFLIGWQPGSSFYCFHNGYGDPPGSDYPLAPEQNLNLGDPLTTGYQTSGSALTRSFQHGFVAVNPTTSSVTVRVPEAVVAFANGSAGSHYAADSTVTLPAHGALLALTSSYLTGTLT